MESKKHDPFLDLSLDIPEKFYNESEDNSNPVCHIADCLSSFTEVIFQIKLTKKNHPYVCHFLIYRLKN